MNYQAAWCWVVLLWCIRLKRAKKARLSSAGNWLIMLSKYVQQKTRSFPFTAVSSNNSDGRYDVPIAHKKSNIASVDFTRRAFQNYRLSVLLIRVAPRYMVGSWAGYCCCCCGSVDASSVYPSPPRVILLLLIVSNLDICRRRVLRVSRVLLHSGRWRRLYVSTQ